MESSDTSKGLFSKSEIGILSEILIEIQKGCKALDYYPNGHPALHEALGKCYSAVAERLGGLDDIAISVKSRGFFSGFHQVGRNISTLAALAKDFYMRGVRKLFILKDLTADDFNNFLITVHMSPKDLRENGGVEFLLSDKGVRTIWLNEINYDRLIGKDLSYKDETEDLASKEREDNEANTLKPAPFAIEDEENTMSPFQPEEDRAEKGLSELLAEIRGELDSKRYEEIVALMIPLAEIEVAEGRLDIPEEILSTLSDHIDNASQLSTEKERSALGGIRGIATPPLIRNLVSKFCDRKGGMDIYPILLKIGEPSIEPLLDMLSETSDMHSRRVLSQVVQRFGRGAIDRVKGRLEDERWFVVRNMTSILGDIGGKEDCPVLEALMGHSDDRVRKEAIKSLSRVGGAEAAAILIKRFNGAEKALQRIILFSLGVLEEPSALPVLLKTAHRKGVFAGDQDMRKEAILALGKLGMDEAVATLREILTADQMFRREQEDIRLASAQSLAVIGSEMAVSALKEGLKTGSDEIKKACEKFLKAIDATGEA